MSPSELYRFEPRTETALLLAIAALQAGLPLAQCQGLWDAALSTPLLMHNPAPGPWYFVAVPGHAEGAAEGDYAYGDLVVAEGGLWVRRASAVFSRLAPVQDLPAAHIAIESGVFSRASGQMAVSVQGRPFYNHYSGQVTVTIQTPRDAGGAALHQAWLGLVRAAAGLAGPDLSRDGLAIPPYELIEIEETGGGVSYVRDGERDRTEIVLALQLGIPGAAMDYSQTA